MGDKSYNCPSSPSSESFQAMVCGGGIKMERGGECSLYIQPSADQQCACEGKPLARVKVTAHTHTGMPRAPSMPARLEHLMLQSASGRVFRRVFPQQCGTIHSPLKSAWVWHDKFKQWVTKGSNSFQITLVCPRIEFKNIYKNTKISSINL